MRLLAIVSIMLLPATVFLGFFGTSFASPRTTFPGFIDKVGLVVVTTVGAVVLLASKAGGAAPPHTSDTTSAAMMRNK